MGLYTLANVRAGGVVQGGKQYIGNISELSGKGTVYECMDASPTRSSSLSGEVPTQIRDLLSAPDSLPLFPGLFFARTPKKDWNSRRVGFP